MDWNSVMHGGSRSVLRHCSSILMHGGIVIYIITCVNSSLFSDLPNSSIGYNMRGRGIRYIMHDTCGVYIPMSSPISAKPPGNFHTGAYIIRKV